MIWVRTRETESGSREWLSFPDAVAALNDGVGVLQIRNAAGAVIAGVPLDRVDVWQMADPSKSTVGLQGGEVVVTKAAAA